MVIQRFSEKVVLVPSKGFSTKESSKGFCPCFYFNFMKLQFNFLSNELKCISTF